MFILPEQAGKSTGKILLEFPPNYLYYISSIMNTLIILIVSAGLALYVSFSEKANTAVKVIKDKSESRLVSIAGEGEVAIQMYINQYATLKEKLVRMKTLQYLFNERLDEAYAANDSRRMSLYSAHLKQLNEKVPQAENNLKEFFDIFQLQKNEIRLLKDELASYKAMGNLSDSLGITSEYEKRGAYIQELQRVLKEKVQRARSLMDVASFEETYTKN